MSVAFILLKVQILFFSIMTLARQPIMSAYTMFKVAKQSLSLQNRVCLSLTWQV